MKLLLDENLSRRLVPFLQQDYPGSTQVALIGLERALVSPDKMGHDWQPTIKNYSRG